MAPTKSKPWNTFTTADRFGTNVSTSLKDLWIAGEAASPDLAARRTWESLSDKTPQDKIDTARRYITALHAVANPQSVSGLAARSQLTPELMLEHFQHIKNNPNIEITYEKRSFNVDNTPEIGSVDVSAPVLTLPGYGRLTIARAPFNVYQDTNRVEWEPFDEGKFQPSVRVSFDQGSELDKALRAERY